MPEERQSYVGMSLPRVEDDELLRGRARFVDDIDREGQAHASIVRSPVAHGRIVEIDPAAALRRDDVLGVFSARDLPEVRIPIRGLDTEEARRFAQPPLAREVVRYVGEPVAVVVAEDPYAAEDAAEAVRVEVSELDPVIDVVGAEGSGATILHEEAGSNVVEGVHSTQGAAIDAVLAGADVVIAERLSVQRHSAIPMETRGLLAELDQRTERLTVWGPTKAKHFSRLALSGLLGIPEASIRMIEPHIGGGFGVRGEFFPEDFLVPWLAMRLRRPVKWIEDRREHFLASNHSREEHCTIEIGAAADGTLLGFRARCLIDQGAYVRIHGGLLFPILVAQHLPGPYAWEGFEVEACSVVTNKTPAGTYRGPGMFESTYFRERMLDLVAARLEIDPAELRRRNLMPAERTPFQVDLGASVGAVTYEGDYPLILESLLDGAGYARLRGESAECRRRGELTGVGLAAWVEIGLEGSEYARVVPEPDAGFTVYVGLASIGQGIRTAISQIAADRLGVAPERIEVVHDDTDAVPEGTGSFASRSTVIGGGAVVGAVADLRERAISRAAEELEISAGDLEMIGGVVGVRGTPARSIPLAELGCEGEHRFEKPYTGLHMGAHLATVEIDRDTGAVSVTRLAICKDVGRMVNPLIVKGQIAGAGAQGLGGALFEELAYDPRGQPTTTSFMDYLVPGATEVPRIDALPLEHLADDARDSGALGAKGAGECGVIGVGAAVANAVADALDLPGARAPSLPLTPERVRSLLDGA